MSYVRGANRERQLQKSLEALGWVVTRAAGSKASGGYDLHCSKAGEGTWLVQVKADARGPFNSFGPADRGALRAAAAAAGAQAWLAWWPADRRGVRWLPVSDWPG